MSGIASEQETIQKIQEKNNSIISAHKLNEQQTIISKSITELSKMDLVLVQELAVSTMALQSMKKNLKNDSKSSPREAQKRLQRKCQHNTDEFDALKDNLRNALNTLFEAHDINNDGHLDSEESLVLVNHFIMISKQMMQLSIKSHIMLQVAANIDASMVMNKPLLLHSFITKESLFEDTTAAWFAVLDKHYIPKIDKACEKHCESMLALTKQLKEDIFAELDTNADGSVTKEEFVIHFHDLSHKYATFPDHFAEDVVKACIDMNKTITEEVAKDLSNRVNDRNECCTVM